jgi:hypothetical protein
MSSPQPFFQFLNQFFALFHGQAKVIFQLADVAIKLRNLTSHLSYFPTLSRNLIIYAGEFNIQIESPVEKFHNFLGGPCVFDCQ